MRLAYGAKKWNLGHCERNDAEEKKQEKTIAKKFNRIIQALGSSPLFVYFFIPLQTFETIFGAYNVSIQSN